MKENFIAALGMTVSASAKQHQVVDNPPVDIILIGGGVMSATLGTYLKALEPGWTIHMYERLEKTAEESSNGWNNAGTGHAAFCELNYTTLSPAGSVDISKAVAVNESFEISRQFWAYLVKQKILTNPQSFINNVPHMSFVWGEDNIRFLRQRFDALQTSTLFRGMEYSENPQQIREWAPLVMDGRDTFQKVAATRMAMGTDVNFGEMTQQLLAALQQYPQFHLHLQHDVVDIKRNADQTWSVRVADHSNGGRQSTVCARHVFIGGGGASLTLLQKSGIPEVNGYAGFPVGGQFLVATNPEVVGHHHAKVYGKASVGAPPMSVPHIDTRILDGKQALLFGPFATFSSKFLKRGSWLDLFHSLTRQNLLPMLRVGLDNFGLMRYLIGQLLMSDKDRLNALREYYPQATMADWSLIEAGQRVQVIKKDAGKGGILQFGTEVVSSADGSLSVLLGASPGASTAAPIMLELLASMFKEQVTTDAWQRKLKEMVPSYGQTINGNLALTNEIRLSTSEVLGLTYIEAKPLPGEPADGKWEGLQKAM
ncbi:malate:quinone oxidoreductase [Sodalis glossinidius str. 'morsitans']|uniref:Probable malate:quinone oxidoreductase n=2 Tax=Sodalis glossinidius (strain morsitans) TaxID=343509 RepID=MQO_SODGM|nr:RecName: Full=Probable malate:quinone oxidoreductase; AltName: Full=MQO; AltName: Full=Malate dehydrogenase [quinone] [Sodalis glossinidius str. 'morsitans']BAE75026.1 malate:quinone oxidoreductase [Sodalis glossinidius str. 'morsitans']